MIQHFKMLFSDEEHKDILISLLNSLLGFSGNKAIMDVTINPRELLVSKVSNIRGESDIASSVDLLCTNKGKQKIAIEIQGQRTNYFLAREQVYMAKLVAGQVKEGESILYHEKLLDNVYYCNWQRKYISW